MRTEDPGMASAHFSIVTAAPESLQIALNELHKTGGWTRVLRSFGAQVAAVDPAELAPPLQRDELVLHYRETAQVYLRHAGEFDIIVNDMKMDVGESAALMTTAARSLRPGGIGVMTLKLPKRQQERLVTLSLDRLRHAYEIIGARQLYHNRSEVTVALRTI